MYIESPLMDSIDPYGMWSSGREERVVRDYYMDDEEVMDTVRRYCL